MRVQNGAVDSAASSTRSDAAQSSGAESRLASSAPASGSADRVSLSNATSLLSLAKGMMPADKQAKLESVAAQFRSGQYQADAPGVSEAIVQGHIQR